MTRPSPVPEPDRDRRAEAVLAETERAELEARLTATRRAARRHTLWALLGFSPGALALLVASAHELGMAAAGVVSMLVVAVEARRTIRAYDEVEELEGRLEAASGRPPDADAGS